MHKAHKQALSSKLGVRRETVEGQAAGAGAEGGRNEELEASWQWQ